MRRNFANNIISGIFNTLYPSTCPACSLKTDTIAAAPFCLSCWSTMSKYTGASCRICAEPFMTEYSGICGHCIKNPPPFSKALCFGRYEKVLAQAIHALKFQKIKRLHRPLGKLLLQLELPQVDAVIPIPMHLNGLRERGFNQSLLLAKVVAEGTRTPLIIDRLIKGKETPPQIGLTAKERTANLSGAFSALRSFSGMRILLVDDVMTTGATARAGAKALRLAGADDVTVCTLARAAAT
ncbi:MAG: ComF family protein [Thermodesulfovibrio sp.]|nr:ComF family protein [Thermodesulfovibrio sp.]